MNFWAECYFNAEFITKPCSTTYWPKTTGKKVGNALRNAKTLISIGEIYYYVKQPDLSKKSQRKSLFWATQYSSRYWNGIKPLGTFGRKTRLFERSPALQEKALSNFTKIDDKEGIALVLEGLGSVYEDEGNYERAGQYFYKAYQMHEENGDLYMHPLAPWII